MRAMRFTRGVAIEVAEPATETRQGDNQPANTEAAKKPVAGYLGLVLDPTRHTAYRQGYPPLKLAGNVRLWQLLETLYGRQDAYHRKNDLAHDVWGPAEIDPEESTIWSAISDLRKYLKQLGLTIKHTKGIGYRLEELRVVTPEQCG